ncbi:hypothetical protein MUB24_03330 [Lederbergia sp. NSJ-179]|uniref:hypothetical protein n=1 Tax=Lederbergia sp. NSJ-179 TaxID=2931402 RepID=UPI001FD18D0C|nr:hypothetical protein [Lederbergia sp. NSJ-179]MCJ7839959.1 hypothetical protein [Lederbergia sp. NSJ-179]
MKKLQDEMKKANNPYVTLIGDYLLDHLRFNPGDADKINAKDKSIQGSLDAMKKAAEKKKVGNMAVLTDEEGFSIVCDYFGIKGKTSGPSVNAPAQESTEADLTINITLGGA